MTRTTISHPMASPQTDKLHLNVPEIEVTPSPSVDLFNSPRSERPDPGWAAGMQPDKPGKSILQQSLETAATRGVLHDCLQSKNGLPAGSVVSWKLM